MFGIPIVGPTNGFFDNKSVVLTVMYPESPKCHKSISCQEVQESVAMGAQRIKYESGKGRVAKY